MLHIHNGESTAGTLRQSEVPGEHFAWREALISGPAAGVLDDDASLQTRATHLAGAYGMNATDQSQTQGVEYCKQGLREQAAVFATLRDHEEVVLWFEHDLFCQANLIYLLDWFKRQELGKTKLGLICVGEFPRVEDFRGLGQLTPEQLASLYPQRREITEAQLDLGARAWAAFSSFDPETIEALIESDTSQLPFLQTALRKHLQRFPSVRNGLGRTENLALELIASGHNEFGKLFPGFGKAEPIYGYGDAQVFVELKRLATVSQPLLTINNAAASALNGEELLKSSFHLTEHGKAVLSGDEDFVSLNGIDLWLGGVHLEGREAQWRWDDERQNLIRT